MPHETKAVPPEELLAHAAWLRRLASVLVGVSNDPDDLVQEAWIAALRRPPRADAPPGAPDPSVRSWLAEVVRNAARMRARGAGRRAARDAAFVAEGTGESPSPEALLERLRTQRLLAELVAGLAEPYRATLLLHYYEGLPLAEIARLHSVPAGTVRWRLKTGLDKIRARLDRENGGERRLWCAALLPLANAPAVSWASVVKSLLKGVWIMSRALKIAAFAAVAVAGATVLTLLRRQPPSPATAAAAPLVTRRPAAGPQVSAAAARSRRARDAMRDEIVAALRRREASAAPTPEPASAPVRPTEPAAPPPRDDEELPRGHYDPEYIRQVFREDMFPLLYQCYESALEQAPSLHGKLVLSFSIVADPEIGGVVEDADFAPESDLEDAAMETCVRESLMSLTFDKPPVGGGYVTVQYPVEFAPGDADAGHEPAERPPSR